MDNKGLFKAKTLFDESEIVGYFLRSGAFAFIITPYAAEHALSTADNETVVAVTATRVLEQSVEAIS